MTRSERAIIYLLRFDAAAELSAIVAVLMPFSMMQQIYEEWLGMIEIPSGPLVEYLARSVSAFYVLHGAITLFISFDIKRYWPLIRFWAASFVVLGFFLLGIDYTAGLPWYWALSEGFFPIVFGGVLLVLHRHASLVTHGPTTSPAAD